MKNMRYLITMIIAILFFVGCDNSQNPKKSATVRKAIQWEYTGFGSSEVAYIVDIVSDNPEISKTDTIYKGEKCVIHTLEYQVYEDYITTENPRDKAMAEFCDNIKQIKINLLYNSEVYPPEYYMIEFNSDYTDMKSYLFDLSHYVESGNVFCFNINYYALAELETHRGTDLLKKISFYPKWHNKMDTTMSLRMEFSDESYLQGVVFEAEIEPNDYVDLPEFYTFDGTHVYYYRDPTPEYFTMAFPVAHIIINCGDISYDNRVDGYRKPFFRYENYEYIQDVGLSYLFTKDSFADY